MIPGFLNRSLCPWQLGDGWRACLRALVSGLCLDGYSGGGNDRGKNLSLIPFRDVRTFGKYDIGCELIPLSANRNDQSVVFGIVSQCLSQVRNILRQIRLFHEGVSPDRSEQFVLCNQAVGVLSQEKQDVEGFRGQGDKRFFAV